MGIEVTSLAPALIRKYDVQGAYYTSYPTGRQWTGDFGAEDYVEGLKTLLQEDAAVPLSLYLHIPFCTRRCRFCFCFTEITHEKAKIDAFLGVLFAEINLFRRLFESFGVRPNIREIHLGGGSPSYLDLEQLAAVIEHLQLLVDIRTLDEFTLEADAITVTEEKLLAYHELGINRISFGIQDFDEEVQQAIGRVQTPALIAQLMSPAVRRCFRGINFDLMYGLPFQTRDSFRNTMRRVIDLAPDRAAIYNYCHMPDLYPHQATIQEANMPGSVDKALIFADAAEFFTQHGYQFIGIDHFARPMDDLALAKEAGTLMRHFMGYTAGRTPHLLGLGPTSISGFGGNFAHNVYAMEEYQDAIREGKLPVFRGYRMTDDDRIRWAVISHFLAHMSVDLSDIGEQFGIDSRSYFADELSALRPFVEDGLAEWTEDGFQATDVGRFFARHVCTLFDRYASVEGREVKSRFTPAIQRSQS